MADRGFHITLPSHARTCPQNTSWDLPVALLGPLELCGKWELGLEEILQPHSWNTISKDTTFETALRGTAGPWALLRPSACWWHARTSSRTP